MCDFKPKTFTFPEIDFAESALKTFKESSIACSEFGKRNNGGKGSLVGRKLKNRDSN